ncbi:Uu.00g010430.m01.CDS01 [Anthostomella pinea]|uniref:tRNA (guanine(26)-N(2))-dimethyltransferase n=1 Tax=Anthostomella pinea TaxID=933095 RepID=A0AAI8VXI9_9PEZI|nr:Uu.00g010430.m01.CDS01 [Anthostomella pinea]
MAKKPNNGTSAAPTPMQSIARDGQEYTEVKEGLARILVPFSAKESAEKTAQNVAEQQKVFYNPIQQFNRDLTVLAIKAYGEQVLSKPPSANTQKVAKRKREKADAGDRTTKKPQVDSTVAEGAAPTVDTARNQEPTAGEDSAMTDVCAGKDNVATKAIPAAEQPSGPPKEHENKPEEDKKSNAPQPRPFTILDALSATGLRALRYTQEIPFVTSVTANDLDPSAVEAIRRNAEHNGVQSKMNAVQGDARAHMYSVVAEEVTRDHARQNRSKQNKVGASKRYDVIDLDPYGTAATFFDAAVNAVRDDGGLLCVTCTDSAVWASNGYPEKAFSLYGGIPLKGFFSHEVGLRIILHGIATAAARYGLAIEPILSLSIDYYVRIFVKIRKSPAQVKFLAGKTMVVFNCDHGCGAWKTQLLARNKKAANKSGTGAFYKHGLSMAPTANESCEHCGSKMHLAGPMYAGPLHSHDFINKILDDMPNAPDDIYGTKPRIQGMLQTALEETIPPPEDTQPSCKDDDNAAVEPYPFFFHPSSLAGAMHCICPNEDSLRGALRHLGYEVTRSHCKPGSMKTNAPWSVIWHIMREWVRQDHPVKVENLAANSPARILLRLPKEDAAAAADSKEKNDDAGEEKDDGAELAKEKADDTVAKRDEPTEPSNEQADAPMIEEDGPAEHTTEIAVDVVANKDGAAETSKEDNDPVAKLEVVFDQKLGRDKSKKGIVRYQTNPRGNWGPQSRAKGR